MHTLVLQIKADRIKLRQTPFFLLHAGIPLVGIAVFIAYLIISPYQTNELTGYYFQVLGLAYPVIIALLTTIITEQEVEAGGAFHLLAIPNRSISILSKLVYLCGFGLFSCLFFAIGYSGLTSIIEKGAGLSLLLLIKAGILLWFSNLFGYLLHTWISLRFGKSANFGMAAFEVLLTALLLTGLGDTIWLIVPCAWSARTTSILLRSSIEGNLTAFAKPLVIFWVIFCATFIIIGIVLRWFTMWEGRKEEE